MENIFTKKIENSDKFRIPAITFLRSGAYCFAPVGTLEYKEYWDREMDRCLNGYRAPDGDWISGYNYFYLNYCVIDRTVNKKIISPTGNEIIRRERIVSFPVFYDYDYYFFMAVQSAEEAGKHLCVLKSRRKGYSYKCGSMMARNFYLIPNSKSYAYASDMQYLDKDGIMTKFSSYLDHVDKHTAWGKKRDVIDRSLHKRASFIIKDSLGNKIEQGYKSEVMGVTIGKDPDKVRGKAGKLILFEEAGKCPELEEAWTIARPSVETDNEAFGLMIAFGTGGSEGADFKTLKDMFYNPNAYNMIGFDNIWDEGMPDKKCGFFVPQYTNIDERDDENKRTCMDDDGNTLISKSLQYILDKRKPMLDNATSTSQIDRYVAENCITPQEACLEIGGNIFPKKDLQMHLSSIRTHKTLQSHKQIGDLIVNASGEIEWVVKKTGDITSYKLEKNADRTGAIVIWEHPPRNTPYGLYIAGCDPYDHDSSTTDSLGSVFIFKRFQNFEEYYDLPVAEYTGRPDGGADEFYENVRRLLTYYNATLLYENQNKGLFAYFKNKHCEYLLADQPSIIRDIVNNSTVERAKGVHMTENIKDWGESLIRDWLIEEYAEGKRNLTKILSEPLLEELIGFNRKRGNYDRVMAFMMVMIYRVQLHELHIKQADDPDRKKKFLDFPIFKDL